MRTTVYIGDKAVDMLCNAVTPIVYKSAFHQDVLVAMMKRAQIQREDPTLTPEEVAKLTPEERQQYMMRMVEYSEKMLDLLSDLQDTVWKLGHVMARQAEAADAGKTLLMTSISENTYMEWLSQFEADDMTAAMQGILRAYNLSAEPKSQPKNQSDRPIENTTQPSIH